MEVDYRLIVESAEDSIFIINHDLTVEYVNTFGAGLLGGSPEMIIGQNLADLFPPDVARKQSENIAKVFDTGNLVDTETRHGFKDRSVWLSNRLIPIHDNSGAVKAVLGISRDITKLKETERILKDHERELRKRLTHAAYLNKLGYVLISSFEADEMLKRMAEGIGLAFGVDMVLVYRVDFGSRVIDQMGEWINPKEPAAKPGKKRYNLSEFASGIQGIRKNRKPLISHYDQVNPLLTKDGSSEIIHGVSKVKSILWYPFNFQQNVLYVLSVICLRKRHDWSDEEIRLADSFTNQLTVALHKIKLIESKAAIE